MVAEDVDAPGVEDPAVVAVLEQELVAQALEQLWHGLIAPKVKTPTARARFLLWAEDQAGRPLRLR